MGAGRPDGRVMSTKVVLSDLGGVLIDFSFDLAAAEWARLAGSDAHAFGERLVVDEAWEAFEVGRLTEREFCAHLRKALNVKLSDDELIEGWSSIYVEVNGDVEQLLRQVVAEGIRVVAVTNTNVSHERVWRDRFASSLEFFGAIYSSWEVRARKPEQVFFERVLQSEQLAPDEALFIDDLAVNVDGAKRLGIDAILYTSTSGLQDALARRGLLQTLPSL